MHASKGREWKTVVLLGFEADRIPNRRSLVGADDTDRAMEEEPRLAYVALTRATRHLILAFDPSRPSSGGVVTASATLSRCVSARFAR